MADMVRLNELLEADPVDREALVAAVGEDNWLYCLWGVDATREITTDSVMNEMHLRFLIIARLRWHCGEPPRMALRDLLSLEKAHLFPAAVHDLSLRQLLDTVQNLQELWRELIDTEEPDALYAALDACLVQFGWLASRAHGAHVLDCEDMVEARRDGSRSLSNACVRKFAAFFYVAYRHAHLAASCVALTADEPLSLEMHSHLVTASLDDFYRLSMYWDMRMASVLQYRHEFTGMFHSISQVMYYNNPSYARRLQIPQHEILSGAFPEHMLPVLMQLFPDIRILHEDDPLPDGFAVPGSESEWDESATVPSACAEWVWIVLPGRIYLASAAGHLLHCPNLAPLANIVHRRLAP